MPKERCMLGYDSDLSALHMENIHEYLVQVKWDGNRAVTEFNRGTVHIVGRSGEDWTDRLPEMVEALQQLAKATAATYFKIDGEIVVFKDGHSHLPSANARVHTKDRQRIKLILRRTLPVTYMIFDVLNWNGNDFTGASLTRRDEILENIFQIPHMLPDGTRLDGRSLQLQIPGLQKVPTYSNPDECWEEWVMKRKEEGVMLKKKDSIYMFDRSRDWLKIKARDKGTFKVVGYTAGNGNREELYGALVIANPTTGAYCGRCGGGFSQEMAEDIITVLKHEPQTGLPFTESEVGRPYTAVDTHMLVEVAFQATDNYSTTGKLRSPQLIRWWIPES